MYELKLSQQEMQVILAGLGELPMKVAAGVYASVRQQVQAQDAANAIDLTKQPQG